MDILEMDHFREPELDEVQFFLESTGTHGSIVNENAVEMECTSSKIQSRESVLVDFDDSLHIHQLTLLPNKILSPD